VSAWHFLVLGAALTLSWMAVFNTILVVMGRRRFVGWLEVASPVGLWLWFLWLRGVL
jgi:hypothetical protein